MLTCMLACLLALQMNQQQRRTGVHQANPRLWTLRMHMAYFVDSLYAFLQVGLMAVRACMPC